MRYDPIAPSVTFEPPDPSDPLRVAITASDRHSGVVSGEIEIRRVGTSAWHGIDTKLSSPGLVAYVDDERFRNGVYEFRAHATDRAGNEASIGPKDAGAASLRLPVRATTKLRAGVRRIKIKRRVVHRDGRRQTVRKRVVVLDPRLRAGFGSRVRLHGRLTNADGQPLDAATVDVLDADSRERLLGTVQTGLRRIVQLPLESNQEPRHPIPISRLEENRRCRGGRSHPGPGGEHHPGRSLDGAKWRFGSLQRPGAHRTHTHGREAHRGSGLLPSAVENVLDGPFGLPRTMGVPIRVRRHDRSCALPLPSASAGRGRLSVRHRCLARSSRAGNGAVGCEATPLLRVLMLTTIFRR